MGNFCEHKREPEKRGVEGGGEFSSEVSYAIPLPLADPFRRG